MAVMNHINPDIWSQFLFQSLNTQKVKHVQPPEAWINNSGAKPCMQIQTCHGK